MNPAAVIFSVTVILSLAAASSARLYPRSTSYAVALRGPRPEWAHALVPGQIARPLRLPSRRHGPRVLRLGGRRPSAAAVRLPAAESTDAPRLVVLWRENGEVRDISGFRTAREAHGFGSEKAKRVYRKEIGRGFVGQVRESLNRF